MPMSSLLKTGYSLGGRIERTLASDFCFLATPRSHEEWMERALLLSMEAVGWSSPNPAVGCLIVKSEKVIAKGFTQEFRKEHAERVAIHSLQNLDDLDGATIYVTLEPCSHFGSQPPCVDLLVHSPIKTVVIACQDPDPRVNGQGIQRLKDAGKEVIVGVLENEAKAWHFPFIRNRISEKPVWIAKWAQTQDGAMADAQGNSKWITNETSRAYTHWLRQKYDAILVGARTWIRDRPQLSVRDCATPHRRNPHRLIFDPNGALLDEAECAYLQNQSRPVTIYTLDAKISERMQQKCSVTNEWVRWIPISAAHPKNEMILAFKSAVEATPFDRPLQSVFCEGE